MSAIFAGFQPPIGPSLQIGSEFTHSRPRIAQRRPPGPSPSPALGDRLKRLLPRRGSLHQIHYLSIAAQRTGQQPDHRPYKKQHLGQRFLRGASRPVLKNSLQQLGQFEQHSDRNGFSVPK